MSPPASTPSAAHQRPDDSSTPSEDLRNAPPPQARSGPRVVVIGAGFGGIEVAKALGRSGIATTVIDRHNHHLFQPLLYQVATAALSAADIAQPIRSILRPYSSVEVILGEVTEIATDAQEVRCAHGARFPYDYLVVAAGARTSYFGNEWERVAPGLKRTFDAQAIRARLLMNFEHAERSEDPAERARLTTFAVVGGGPTGVELAGSIAELSRFTLARDFRRVQADAARVVLVEAGERILSGFHEDLSAYARRRLERLGVEVIMGQQVSRITDRSIEVGGETIPVGATIWAAGVSASPLARMLGVELDRGGRVPVTSRLEVSGLNRVFALGDIAAFPGENGRPLPGLAQVAKQQGRHLGRALARHIETGADIAPFAYRSRGNTAIIGRHAAVYEAGQLRLRGWLAWMLWAIVHVYLLVGFQHRMSVSIHWLWRYLTYERGARLIALTEEEQPADHLPAAPGPAAR